MPTPYRLTVPGNPLPKGRPRFVRGRAVTPKRTREWEERVWAHCEAQMMRDRQKRFEGDVALTLTFYRKDRRRADLDNLIKAVCDGMEGAVYTNDRQVVGLTAKPVQIDPEHPRVEIEITEITEGE